MMGLTVTKASAAIAILLVLAASASAEEGPDALLVALGSASPEARRTAREELVRQGEEAASILARGLAGDDLVAALACADLLGAGAWRSARGPLRQVLEDEHAPLLLRRSCCLALGRAGDYRDVKLLGSLISSIPEAALAVLEIGEIDAVEPLRLALSDGTRFPEVPYALAALGKPVGLDALISMLTGSSRVVARHYLRRLAGEDYGEGQKDWVRWRERERLAAELRGTDWDASEQTLTTVLKRIEEGAEGLPGDLMALALDPSRPLETRTKALLAIGLTGDAAAGPDLVEILNSDPAGQVRVYAAEALGRVGYAPGAVDLAWYLIFDEEGFRKLSAKNSTIRYYTIDSEVSRGLVRMGIAGGLDFLIRQLAQEHRVRVYHEAIRTLHAVTGQDFGFRPDARRADRRIAAKRWRLWFDEHRGEIELKSNADLSDPDFRRRVLGLVNTLGHYKFLSMSRARSMLVLLGEVALPELRAGLKREETHIRVHCAEILGWIYAKSARGDLAAALADPKPEVRTAAMVALADMGPGAFAADVIRALEDDSPGIRIEAVRALARVEAERSIPVIRQALQVARNGMEAFRREAWFALGVHGEADAVDSLAGLLSVPVVASRQETADRLLVLTGKDPGIEPESIAKWEAWWKVYRTGYTPLPEGGRIGNDVTDR